MDSRPDEASVSAAVTALARDLIDDIELSRAPVASIVLKALRLAQLVGDQSHIDWLRLEVQGYYADSGPMADDYARRLGRFTDLAARRGYFGPIAEIDAQITAQNLQIQTLRVPDLNLAQSSANPNEFIGSRTDPGQWAQYTISNVVAEARNAAATITALTAIRARVIAWVHMFATKIYQERVFSGLSESIFEEFKLHVDELLASRAGDTLGRLPAASARLAEGGTEAISQALLTCRRILDAFTDEVFPPSDVPRTVDGQIVDLGPDKHKNRLRAYVDDHVQSRSRRAKLKRSISDLHDRVSTAVHGDVDADEARALFLETYTLLGQLLQAASPPPTPEEPVGGQVDATAPLGMPAA